MREIELEIESLSYFGGRGVGRFDGRVVFVVGAAPGERARVRITAEKPRFWEGELIEVVGQRSPWRREPPCPWFGRCGGCVWQHVTYEQQAVQKEKILRDSFRRISGKSELKWRPFRAAKNEFSYRNRIQLQVQRSRLGFFAQRTRNLVEIDRCLIAEDKLNRALAEARANVDSLATADSKVELALLENGEVRTMPGQRSPDAALFSQVNNEQNTVLKHELMDMISVKPDWILDLYAGSGNLTVPLAERFPGVDIYAVELSEASVRRGRGLGHKKIQWIASDVGQFLENFSAPPGVGLVITDPPRVGMESLVVNALARMNVGQMIYVSCNPTTAARDIERWMNLGGPPPEEICGIDMFPQTEHVELIVSVCVSK